MQKRGLSQVVSVVLIVMLSILAIVSLWNLFKYFSERAENRLDNRLIDFIVYGNDSSFVKKDQKECIADWSCKEWDSCQISYGFSYLSSEKTFATGLKKRECHDNANCFYDRIEEETCSRVKEITVKKVNINGVDYFEIYDKATSELVVRMKEEQFENFKQLKISIVI